MRRFYLTTPIYYVNDIPHIGTAYTTLAADVVARYHRLCGDDVLLATGTDEHATKVLQAAQARGVDPFQFVAEMADRFREAWAKLNVDYDVFIRTTEERHQKAVQALFRTLQTRGDIYEGPYEGWYCMSCETYFSADEAPEADGVRPCPNDRLHKPLQLVQETNYFFRLSAYQDRLLEWMDAHPEALKPDFRRNEVLAFVRSGLRDVCITRSAGGWGVPVPGDPSQVVYVWFDALINYLTLVGYPDQTASQEKWWPADLHLVGKDIYVRFHCTLWPAMLMGIGLEPPRQVFGHGFWMIEGAKMSKTVGNVVEPVRVAGWLSELSGAPPEIAADALRYCLFREMPFGEDGNFARSSVLARFNSDLANELGNVLNRSLSLAIQTFPGAGGGAVVPRPTPTETALSSLAGDTHRRVTAALETLDLQGALNAAWEYVSAINRYLADRTPWVLARDGKTEELGGVLYHTLEAVRVLTVWCLPYLPCAAREMRRQLGLDGETTWESAGHWGELQPGAPLPVPTPIFPRIDRKVLQAALAAADAAVPASGERSGAAASRVADAAAPGGGPPPAGRAGGPAPTGSGEQRQSEGEKSMEPVEGVATIAFEDFARVELRVAEVLSAERVPKADKLLHLRISLGDEERSVLAGLAEFYTPEQLTGRKVILVANLAPRKIRGLMSQGMLLAAEHGERVSLLQPDQDLPAGARVR